MAQWLRVLLALQEDSHSTHSTYTKVQLSVTPVPGNPNPLHRHASKTPMEINYNVA